MRLSIYAVERLMWQPQHTRQALGKDYARPLQRTRCGTHGEREGHQVGLSQTGQAVPPGPEQERSQRPDEIRRGDVRLRLFVGQDQTQRVRPGRDRCRRQSEICRIRCPRRPGWPRRARCRRCVQRRGHPQGVHVRLRWWRRRTPRWPWWRRRRFWRPVGSVRRQHRAPVAANSARKRATTSRSLPKCRSRMHTMAARRPSSCRAGAPCRSSCPAASRRASRSG